ncbi:hypothetical protein Tco_0089967, partial [Tanacetum coccineum]
TLKDELRKLKGKSLVDNNVSNHPSDPELHQVNVEPITPKLLNKRTAHSAYTKHSQEEAAVLRDLVDHIKANYRLDLLLESVIQEMLSKISKTCPSINMLSLPLITRFAPDLTFGSPQEMAMLQGGVEIIGKSNIRLNLILKSKEPTLQVALDALKLTPFYNAYAISADTPKPKSIKKKADSESSPKTKLTQASKGKIIKTIAKGDKPAKKKQSVTKSKGLTVLSEVALTEAEEIKLAKKRSLIGNGYSRKGHKQS